MENGFSLHPLVLALTIAAILRPISTAEFSPLLSPPTTTSPPPSSSPPTTTIIPPPHSPSKAISPPPKPSSPPTTSSPTPLPPRWADERQEQLLENIVSALSGAGDFRRWASLLSAAGPSTLTPFTTSTLFIPSDEALSHLPTATATTPITFDPFLIPYHIIPQRLSFTDLQLFPTLTRLPTLLPSNSIVITNNSQSNFTVDGSLITHPDLYVNSAVAVHGIKTILDYSVYDSGRLSPPPVTKTPEKLAPPYFPCCGRKSNAARLCTTEFPIVFPVVCAAFAFKISQMKNGGFLTTLLCLVSC